MARDINRRAFLKTAGVAAGAAVAAQHLTAPYVMAGTGAGEKLNVAVIGCGGMGGYAMGQANGQNPVAYCEIDDKRMPKRDGVKKYNDYRKMLDECHKDLDVVLISTPDHHHAPAAIRAINLGKAVFCQKPLAYNIYECRALAEAAKKNKVLTQLGNQGHTGESVRRLVECIWGGAIGNVTETHSMFDRNFGGQGGLPPGKPVPPGLHWDEWLGPAPQREYHDGLHPFSWRSWRQFGTGTLGDMACHVMDAAFWSLKLGEAKNYSIECLAQKAGSTEMFPQSNVIKFEFPARGDMPAVKCFTYDNQGQKSQAIKDVEKVANRRFKDGTVFIGDKGYMFCDTYGGGVSIYPEARRQEFKPPEKTLTRAHGGGPIEDLFWCLKNNGTPCSNFVDYAGSFTEMILTGQLAMFAGPGKKLDWDVAAMKCTNNDDMNQYLKRKYRPGWEV